MPNPLITLQVEQQKAQQSALEAKRHEFLLKNRSYNLAQMPPSMIKDPAITLQLALRQK